MKNTTIDEEFTGRHPVRYEMHHKIPRNLGGTDDPDNLIKVSIEEHFMRHYNIAMALRAAWKAGNKFEMRKFDPSGKDPTGETHLFGAAMIYLRMYWYEIERVKKHISDSGFNTVRSYIDEIQRQEYDNNFLSGLKRSHNR